jgi:hypothetical protein
MILALLLLERFLYDGFALLDNQLVALTRELRLLPSRLRDRKLIEPWPAQTINTPSERIQTVTTSRSAR